ncbi:hypothetical protein [Notoacmeibacter sp. MSK16QG-6]|uniref:hypothetical protein n=1 Tax=Notoacmeibacter sp. MSK16QG-6 TaxID=2957982 RepID=UPI0020A021D1|nr:hypothetical protein [Notoacmeibacter sp. MSK16QG-6]MCP1199743.1 hypothetical protein [Notoacmeibacter sp. MSK16QG-6]
MSEKMTPTEARQGRRGRPILIVMLISIALALIVWFFVGIYGETIAPEESNPAASENADVSSDEDLSNQELDNKAPSPTIEDPAQAPDAATNSETLEEAPGGTTGQREPETDSSSTPEEAPAN